MTAKPILLVKFPISLNINGSYIKLFTSDNEIKQIEERLEFKVKGDYHIIITPSKSQMIEYEVLSLNKDTKELDLYDLKKYMYNLLINENLKL